MVSRIALFLVAIGLAAGPAVADAQRGPDRDQDVAYEARKQGRIMPLREIERRILPHMRGADYLGPELDARSGIYRLKFMRGGRVIWIDIDARTGQVLGRSGN